MTSTTTGFSNILVGTDFSSSADAALRQAIWLARQCAAKLVLAHTLPDLRRAVHSASFKARMELLYGEDALFQREIRQKTEAAMRRLIGGMGANDLDVRFETLLGEASVELTHAVQQDGYDLVLAGTRGNAAWEEFFVGSTAKRLIRTCPAPVWIVKSEQGGPPQVILAPTDFSDVSRKAVRLGLWIAQRTNAEFHVLHVIDSTDAPDELVEKLAQGGSLREDIHEEATQRLGEFVKSLEPQGVEIQGRVSWGPPWKDIGRTAREVGADLIVMGTVGRSGVQGMLLGNTAERVLGSCDCGILSVKPDGFVSPIEPAFWPLHPAIADDPTSPQSDPG